jgi:methylenetetrahydrofolate reductase (NADPH)
MLSSEKNRREETWNSVFRAVRQPEWWKGDDDYHCPSPGEPCSDLERRLKSGEFVVATEITPPVGAGTEKLRKDIQMVRPFVTAINFTESSSARPKMSSVSCCNVAVQEGAEPVLQIAARDTTRTSLQSLAVGLNAMGIRNVLCISGDNAIIGPAPSASMNILDIDSVQMLWIMRKMRDEGVYLDGRKMKVTPRYFLGAATSPFSQDPELQAIRDHKKINAGAAFFQTNLIFEPEKLDIWLEQLDKRNVLDKVYILIGVAPLRSLKLAEYLHTKVPGVNLPVHILDRMKKAGDSAPEEGMQIILELIDVIKGKKGINGIHIMTLGWESVVERIIMESGLSTMINN